MTTTRLFACLMAFSVWCCAHERGTSVATSSSSPSTSVEVPSPVVTPGGESSTLSGGGLIEIRVFQEPDLSGPYQLSPQGTIDYPFCGKMNLSGLTSSQAADSISQCLQKGYLKSPQVSVAVKEFNSKKVFVFGEVQKPGPFPFEERMSLIQAVTMAGGFTKVASKNNIKVTRNQQGQQQEIVVGREKNFVLQPGDIVYVPESFF